SATPKFYLELLISEGNSTIVKFQSVDPSQIMRTAMDNYQSQGGSLTYDEQSIPLTGTETSYDFNNATIFDVIRKALELMPEGWYFYVDQANKKLVCRQKSDLPRH